MIAGLGFEVVSVDISEFRKREGTVSCLSVRLPESSALNAAATASKVDTLTV